MKNILKQTLLIIMIATIAISALITTKVFAANNINSTFTLVNDKTEYKKGDTVIITVVLSNVSSPKGINVIGGVIEYDKNYLENLSVKRANGDWSTPSINSNTGKFVTDYPELTNQTGNLFLIQLKVKDNVTGNANAVVSLKNVELAGGSDKGSVASVSTTIKIVDNSSSQNTVTPPPAETNTVTPPPADTNTVTPPPAETNTVTPPAAETNTATPPPADTDPTPPPTTDPTTPPDTDTNTADENIVTSPDDQGTNQLPVQQIENLPSDKELPKTGANVTAIVLSIMAISVLIIVFYIKMRAYTNLKGKDNKRSKK